MHEIYPNRAALKQIEKLLAEAAAVIGDKVNVSIGGDFSKPVAEAAGGTAGVIAGAAAGAAAVFAGAAPGLAGAAALSNALAGAGALVTGGMAAGIGVVAAPAVILGAAGIVAGKYAVDYLNNVQFHTTKEAVLQEVVRLREGLTRLLPSTNAEKSDYVYGLIAQLRACETNLKKDLGIE